MRIVSACAASGALAAYVYGRFRSQTAEVARLREDLARTHVAAERASAGAQQATARLAHDLRSPLTAIIGFAELMHENAVGPLNETQRECVADISASATNLLRRIDDLRPPSSPRREPSTNAAL